MPNIKTLTRSFSLRLGAMIFMLVLAALFGQRLIAYYSLIENEEEEARLLIDAHMEEITEGAERYGTAYARSMVQSLAQEDHDKNLYLVLRHHNTITGDASTWPKLNILKADYQEILLPIDTDEQESQHLLVKVARLSKSTELLIGYNLERVENLRKELLAIALGEVALAFALSLAISLLCIWLLSRHLRRFNIACTRVMQGELAYRIRQTHAGDEFDRLAAHINRMLDWINTLITTARDTSTAIAHDMRTPLSRLRLQLRALSERPRLNSETRAAVLEHVEEVDELIGMFENILNIAKAESATATEIFELLDIAKLAADVLAFYEPIIEEKHLSVHRDIPPIPLMVRGDKQLLGQALVNLIDNACKYTPANGQLDISLAQHDGRIHFIVADNGSGIPEELRARVVERFFRSDQSRSTPGHGLGLSLVSAVASLHGGQLELEDNAPGLRACFIVQAAQ